MTVSLFALLLLVELSSWSNSASALHDSSASLRRLQPSPSDLATCLRDIPGEHVVVVPNDESYSNATNCHNSARSDRTWSPKAVMKVYSSQQVAAAVQCASLFGITVTPRSGAHGFENEACSGELIVDVSNLLSFQVDTDAAVVEFGAGFLHGQLYRKLIDYGLVVAGGTENSVGTAGLWLGCGRGPLTSVHGLSCDNMLGIEFVDAKGNIRVANATTDTDMFWMARGSGGEFPGVVTKFIAKTHEMPSEVFEVKISFRSDQVNALIKAWAARIDVLSDPSLSMFTNIHSYMGTPILAIACYSCTTSQKEFLMTTLNEIADLAGGGTDITYWGGTWLDRLLKEDWDEYDDESDLSRRPDWPAVWSALSNGAHMVETTDARDEMTSVIQNALEAYGESFYLYMYSMAGPHISNVPLMDTAYGGRQAKYVVHYKFVGSSTEVKVPLKDIAVALDQAGLPCKGFYNYADREFPCASGSGDLWLEAHFSDVPRMKAIKETEDPDDRFMSTLKAKMWRTDVNQLTFVGWPEVGDFGGTCTCPNGAVYQVGDNNDACQSLACVGGISGSCSENNPGGQGYRVVCDAEGAMTTPTAGPTTDTSVEPTLATIETAEPTSAPSLEPTAQPTEPIASAATSTPVDSSPVDLAPISTGSDAGAATSSPTVIETQAHQSQPTGAPAIDLSVTADPPIATSALLPTSGASDICVSLFVVAACTALSAPFT